MHEAAVHCARPMLTALLDPTKKGRTPFAPHYLYNKGPPRPRRGLAGVLWEGPRIPLYSHRLPEDPRSFHRLSGDFISQDLVWTED
jgi:hypothetical protein